MSYKDDSKIFDQRAKYTVKCKCSHTMTIARVDRMICTYCGRWVYRTPAIEFKYRLKQGLIKRR